MENKYDLAISFAGEQRNLAEVFARRLDASGYSIFYDEFQQAELWGRDLSVALGNVYSREARYCLIILSTDYVDKPWTNHERQNAISEFIRRRGEYILVLKVEEIDLPGFPTLIGYISFDRFGEDGVYKLLLQKLGRPNHADMLSHLDSNDTERAQEIIEACFRRAIYTRMDSEINLSSMYGSIGHALGQLQRITPGIHDQSLQFACNEIIRALDEIDRISRYRERVFLPGFFCHIPGISLSAFRWILSVPRMTQKVDSRPIIASMFEIFIGNCCNYV